MATIIETLIFKFLGDTGGLDASIEEISAKLDKVGAITVGVGAAVTTFFTGLVVGSIAAANSIEQTQLALDALGQTEDEQLEAYAESLSGMFKELKESIVEASAEIGKVFLPIAKKLLSWATFMVKLFTDLPGPIKTSIAVFLALGVAFGVVTMAAGVFLLVLSQVITSLAAYGIVITGATLVGWAFTAAVVAMNIALALSPFLLVAIVAVLAVMAGGMIYDAFNAEAIEEFNRQLERSKELSEEMLEINAKAGKREIAELGVFANSDDTASAVNAAMEKSQKNIEGITWQLAQAKKEVEEMAPTWLSLWQATGDQEVTQLKVDELNKSLEQQKAHLKELQELKDAATTHPTIEELTRAYQYAENLKDQIRFLGMTAAEVQKIKFEEQQISEELRAQIELDQERLELKKQQLAEAEKIKQIQADASEYLKSLEDQVRFFGMSADEVKNIKLEEQGVTEEIREQVKLEQEKLADKKRIAEEEKKAAQELVQAEKEIMKAIEKHFKERERLEKQYQREVAREREQLARAVAEKKFQAELDAFNNEMNHLVALESANRDARNFIVGKEFDSSAEGLVFGSVDTAAGSLVEPEKDIQKNTKRSADTLDDLMAHMLEEPALSLNIVQGLV